LILRDVLGWRSAEVAELLHLSVAAVNSALQRARSTLASRDLAMADLNASFIDDASEELLGRYMDAFERYDMEALTALLHEDATQSMPPFPMWLRGRDQLIEWMIGMGAGCVGSRLVPVRVNGQAGFAQYRDGGATPWSIQLPVFSNGEIVEITYFLETDGSLFALFGLAPQLELH
jgi:RNA polymerase sigma-70 factor (ECF subfamily)